MDDIPITARDIEALLSGLEPGPDSWPSALLESCSDPLSLYLK